MRRSGTRRDDFAISLHDAAFNGMLVNVRLAVGSRPVCHVAGNTTDEWVAPTGQAETHFGGLLHGHG